MICEPQPPEKKGYTFVEWRDAMTNEKAVFAEENGIHEEKQYYAIWKEEAE